MNKEYIAKIKEFCSQELSCIDNGDTISVIIDNEISYEYFRKERRIVMYERNTPCDMGRWEKSIIADLQFAMMIKGSVCEGVDYGTTIDFDSLNGMYELAIAVDEILDKQYYSIGKIESNKISIIDDGDYEVAYSYNGNIYEIERDSDSEFIFMRFYNEVLYLTHFMKDLARYEDIFGVSFTEEEIVEILNY